MLFFFFFGLNLYCDFKNKHVKDLMYFVGMWDIFEYYTYISVLADVCHYFIIVGEYLLNVKVVYSDYVTSNVCILCYNPTY